MRILIVEDGEAELKLLRTVLAEAGHDVETARDGLEAIELLRKDHIRMVITDWEMPRMTGPDLCRAIRNEDFPSYVYVILLTSQTLPSVKVDGLLAGADDFMSKPYDWKELQVRVQCGERVLTMESRDVTIFAMAKLAESRDPVAGAHLERVQRYSQVLAQALGTTEKYAPFIDPEYVRLVYQTSPLHDIGKVAIPDAVLLKPGSLDEHERAVMKTHAALGAHTLDTVLKKFAGVKFLEMARDIALTHHERFDGTGYPSGLKGDDIPACGRIVALADVYDALTSRRVYKDAIIHDTARTMVMQETGTHFDPDVIKAFLKSESAFVSIASRFRDQQTDPLGRIETLERAEA